MDGSTDASYSEVNSLANAASENLLRKALLLVGQMPAGARSFPSSIEEIQRLVDSVSSDRWMVNVSVVGRESEIQGDGYRLWVWPVGDGSLSLRLTDQQPNSEFSFHLKLWADGEVVDQGGQASVGPERDSAC